MPRTMTWRVTVCFSPENGQEIDDYVWAKKRWKKAPDFFRDAVEQLMTKNALTAAQRRAIEERHGK